MYYLSVDLLMIGITGFGVLLLRRLTFIPRLYLAAAEHEEHYCWCDIGNRCYDKDDAPLVDRILE